jgi:hypothetical protein
MIRALQRPGPTLQAKAEAAVDHAAGHFWNVQVNSMET